MKKLSPEQRAAILAAIKQGKPLTTCDSLKAAIKYSDEQPKTKPHFLIAGDGGHIIVY